MHTPRDNSLYGFTTARSGGRLESQVSSAWIRWRGVAYSIHLTTTPGGSSTRAPQEHGIF